MIPVYDQFGFVNPRNAALAGAGGVGGRHPMGDVWDRMNHYLEAPAFPGRYTGGGPGYRGWGQNGYGGGSNGWGGGANVYYNTSSLNPFGGSTNFGINGSFGRGPGWGWNNPGWGWNNPGWGSAWGPGWNQGGINLGYNTSSFGPNSVSNFGINGFIPGGSVPKPVGNIAVLGMLGVIAYGLFS